MRLDPLISFQTCIDSLWTMCRVSQVFCEKCEHVLLKVFARGRMAHAQIEDEPGMWDPPALQRSRACEVHCLIDYKATHPGSSRFQVRALACLQTFARQHSLLVP